MIHSARSEWCKRHAHEGTIIILLILLLLFAGFVKPTFLKWESQRLLSRQLWELAILGLPMTAIIIAGGIDLSVGAIMALCAVTFGMCFTVSENTPISVAACLCVGACCGLVNGLLVAWGRVHPLIVTLATMAAFRGLAEGISQGASYSGFGDSFGQLARGTVAGIPWPGIIVMTLAVTLSLFLGSTVAGRYVYAIGHNPVAARFAGIPLAKLRCGLHVVMGLFAGLATAIYVSRFDTAKADAGKGMELDVITAVVVGGTSIFGGKGSIAGTCLGLLLIHETRLFVSSYWHNDELRSILIGTILIVSVFCSRLVSGKQYAGQGS